MKKLLILILISILLDLGFKSFLINETLYFYFLSENLSYERIEEFIAQSKKWEWMGYILIPFIYLIKFSLIATCLSIGYYFSANKFGFKKLWKAVVQAEYIFLLPILIKLLWFLFVQTDYDLNDLGQFYPLSFFSLMDLEKLSGGWQKNTIALTNFLEKLWPLHF